MKNLIALTLLLLAPLATHAQNFDFYALAGPSVSQIDGDRVGGYNKMGAIAGLGIAHSFNQQLQALMELEYISKGKGTYEESTGASYKTNLNYVQLPLLVQYNINNAFFVETGLSAACLFSYQFYENNEPTSSSPFQPTKFELGYLIGSTYAINDFWRVNLRFAYSIIHINELSDDDYYRSSSWKHPLGKYNRSLTLALQYWL